MVLQRTACCFPGCLLVPEEPPSRLIAPLLEDVTRDKSIPRIPTKLTLDTESSDEASTYSLTDSPESSDGERMRGCCECHGLQQLLDVVASRTVEAALLAYEDCFIFLFACHRDRGRGRADAWRQAHVHKLL